MKSSYYSPCRLEVATPHKDKDRTIALQTALLDALPGILLTIKQDDACKRTEPTSAEVPDGHLIAGASMEVGGKNIPSGPHAILGIAREAIQQSRVDDDELWRS